MTRLTDREMELLRCAIKLAVEVDKLCPEVGMGSTRLMLAKELAESLSFEIDKDDLYEACEYF